MNGPARKQRASPRAESERVVTARSLETLTHGICTYAHVTIFDCKKTEGGRLCALTAGGHSRGGQTVRLALPAGGLTGGQQMQRASHCIPSADAVPASGLILERQREGSLSLGRAPGAV